MFDSLTLFQMAQKSLDYLARREEVLSQNVANADTPKFQSKDLAPLSFEKTLSEQIPTVQAVTTNPMHISPKVEPTRFELVTDPQPVESKPDGNSVDIEDQMKKLGDIKNQYDIALNLFQKNLSMLKTALDRGGV